jgi:hypothetical protein
MREIDSSAADAMKVGAENASLRAVIQGEDGAGWVKWIDERPMCTLPPGAGALVVKYFRELQRCDRWPLRLAFLRGVEYALGAEALSVHHGDAAEAYAAFASAPAAKPRQMR